MTMITPSYLGETIEYSSLHACRSTLEDPTELILFSLALEKSGDGCHGYQTLAVQTLFTNDSRIQTNSLRLALFVSVFGCEMTSMTTPPLPSDSKSNKLDPPSSCVSPPSNDWILAKDAASGRYYWIECTSKTTVWLSGTPSGQAAQVQTANRFSFASAKWKQDSKLLRPPLMLDNRAPGTSAYHSASRLLFAETIDKCFQFKNTSLSPSSAMPGVDRKNLQINKERMIQRNA